MLNWIIKFSLRNRLFVVIMAIAIFVYGGFVAFKIPVDVFPDLNRPVVTVMTEAQGLAPEEVEILISLPLETSLNGIPGLERIRSSSGMGLSIVYLEFEWGTDIYRNRQFVNERLQIAKDRLPENVVPIMAPTSSIMGEIQFLGLRSEGNKVDPMELRTVADWVVRPRLMALTGISQVIVMGGDVKQYQILFSSEKLLKMGIDLETLKKSLSSISQNTTGGFLDSEGKELLIRPIGRAESIEDIENTLIGQVLGRPVYVKDVAEVKIGSRIKRGKSSINASPAVILSIQKQPGANTITLTKQIDEFAEDLQKTLPPGIIIEKNLFKQAHFIQNSVNNVQEAMLEGIVLVGLILFAFLVNARTTFITLTAIPLSFIVATLIFKFFGLSINTMTLGGLAIAIGEVIDDATVDVENVFRRLRENNQLANPRSSMVVIYEASSEIRNSIVFSTAIVAMVFVPLFALDGIEGKLFAPLGIAYIVSLLASLVVSLTLTPALCSYLLPKLKAISEEKDSLLVSFIKRHAEKVVRKTLNHPYMVIFGGLTLLTGALALVPLMGKNFLPEFNEGTATINALYRPGISLDESDRKANEIEKLILSVPEVKSTVRRTGRAELDEHAEGVHYSEIDVDFKPGGRDRKIVLEEIRKKAKESDPDVFMNIGQPISHRLDHLLSGVRAQIAIKIFGQDLAELRRLANEISRSVEGTEGLVDLQVEQLISVPQLKMVVDRELSGINRINVGSLTEELEIALNGDYVGKIIEGQRVFDIFTRLDDKSRASPESIENTLVKILPSGDHVKAKDVVDIYEGTGPNMINKENLQRRIIISANTAGRDLQSVVDEINKKIAGVELPQGYYIKLGGQFESQQSASRMISILSIFSMLGIFFLLYIHFKSSILSLQVMLNVPMALIGSIVAIFITERVLSVATLVAFITLCGIASRNGIMMISHYLHLLKEEGEEFTEKMVIRGTVERMIPVLMTAVPSILAVIPLALSQGEPGKEILYPVGVVIIGGVLSSTLLDLIVTPTIFYHFGKKSSMKWLNHERNKHLNKELL